MDNNIIKLKKIFDGIANKGWIMSSQKGTSGVGITFEKLIGKNKENFEIPDFEGIEIKTKITKIYIYHLD